jgi:hypothetical protein
MKPVLASLLTVFCLLALAGCTKEDTSVNTITIGAPQNVSVTPVSATAITVSWTRGVNDTKADTVVMMQSGLERFRSVSTATATSLSISGLSPGIYEIAVLSAGGSSPFVPWTINGGATNLMALSLSATSIALEWTRDPADAGIDTVVATNGGVTLTVLPTTASAATITGLTEGTGYTFSVHNGLISPSISWMTARRTTGLKIYEYSSPNPAGLQLNGADGHAHVLNVTSQNLSSLDFLLDDVQRDPTITSPSGLAFEGPQIFDATLRSTFIDQAGRYVVGGLDADFSSFDFSSFFNGSHTANEFDLPATFDFNTRGSRVLLVATSDGHFAKVEVVPNPTTGQLYSGTGTNRFITVNVSYQSAVGQPYAGRPHQIKAPQKRIRAE